jgi:hypothetical protein
VEKDILEIIEHVLVRKRKGTVTTRGSVIDWAIS